jgi:hypothetical protein
MRPWPTTSANVLCAGFGRPYQSQLRTPCHGSILEKASGKEWACGAIAFLLRSGKVFSSRGVGIGAPSNVDRSWPVTSNVRTCAKICRRIYAATSTSCAKVSPRLNTSVGLGIPTVDRVAAVDQLADGVVSGSKLMKILWKRGVGGLKR